MRGGAAFFNPTLGQTKNPRTPRRTAKELAEEFEVSSKSLAQKLRVAGIRPCVARGDFTSNSSWYDADAVRAWWKARNTQ